jgi:hypothetical protein
MKPQLGDHLAAYWMRTYTTANTKTIWVPSEIKRPILTTSAPTALGRRSIMLAVLLCAATLLALLTFGLAHAQPPTPACDSLDRNCDNVLNIVDFQQLANQIGATGVATPVLELMDVDGNGLIDPGELVEVAPPTWRTQPTAPRLSTLGGPPRLGLCG